MTWRARRPARQSSVTGHPSSVTSIQTPPGSVSWYLPVALLANIGFLRSAHRHRRQVAAATNHIGDGLLEGVDAFDFEPEMIRAGALDRHAFEYRDGPWHQRQHHAAVGEVIARRRGLLVERL